MTPPEEVGRPPAHDGSADPVGDVAGARTLLRHFTRACADAGAQAPQADVEAAGADLLRRWSHPARGYHDPTHLSEVVDRLAEIGGPGAGAACTRLAAWFHDAVYTGSPGRDERESAELAERELTALGVPGDLVDRVGELVLVTASHRPEPDDEQARALCDADLAVLAADPSRYTSYTQGVRREYAHVPDDAFRAGRARLLAALLSRQDLFSTDHARRHWDAAARANVAAELARLGGAAPVDDGSAAGADAASVVRARGRTDRRTP